MGSLTLKSLIQFSRLSDCNTLQHIAPHCNTLQRTATHCNALQHTATHCPLKAAPVWGSHAINSIKLSKYCCGAACDHGPDKTITAKHAARCNTLQHAAYTHPNDDFDSASAEHITGQHAATHCNNCKCRIHDVALPTPKINALLCKYAMDF